MNLNRNDLVPAIIGGAWGAYLYGKQDHTRRPQPVLQPGPINWVKHHSERLLRGKLGAILAVATSIFSLLALTKFSQQNRYPFLNLPVKLFTIAAFAFFSQPTRDPQYKALLAILRTTFKIYTTLVPIHDYITLYDARVAEHNRQNPVKVPDPTKSSQELMVPFLLGCVWGNYLCTKNDSNRMVLHPPRPPLEEWCLLQINRIKDSILGQIGTIAESGFFLMNIDILCSLSLTQNNISKKYRYAAWLIFFLFSYPFRERGFKSIDAPQFAFYITQQLVQSISLFDYYSVDFAKVSAELFNNKTNSLKHLLPTAIGGTWGASLYYLHHFYHGNSHRKIELITTLASSALGYFAYDLIAHNSFNKLHYGKWYQPIVFSSFAIQTLFLDVSPIARIFASVMINFNSLWESDLQFARDFWSKPEEHNLSLQELVNRLNSNCKINLEIHGNRLIVQK